jgi:hypothetical protein
MEENRVVTSIRKKMKKKQDIEEEHTEVPVEAFSRYNDSIRHKKIARIAHLGILVYI